MAVQPLVQEIQKNYKDNPEKLQKEMMRLYKEHGFNPLAGCVPMLLPWPVLIALFFVFQNTIELRGVPFLWLPDLSAKDPLFILPVMLAVSMFLMQWVSLRSLDQPNPQMKMMMWLMPGMMLFIFMNLASGLNLYYATANIATIPQQVWIANERKKMRGRPPPKLSSD
jgi:YidC/Oxa1 family membrane protein insertase